MDTARIAALLAPFLEPPLPPAALDQISTYIDLLLRWNGRINLTAIRHPEQIVTRHFGESLFLARHLFPAPPEGAPSRLRLGGDVRVLDIGSGAGFPALPLKIWAPQIQLTLIESNHKKATFLREAARALTLTDINVITDRAEVLAARPDFPRTDMVTLRAVESFEAVLPQAIALLNPKGTLALLVGAAQIPYLTTLTAVKWHPPIPLPQSTRRVLAIGILQ
ncbi:MAG: 16S rRNA (guanine(527)-N(7))-methyltransferase RsmG [Acidobacteriota bacterium]|nr:16S rRNA (guanine(527)-N(7))-methyltransferase RsmG [Acidobacteriota bacterium]